MRRRIAFFSDVHGNIHALRAMLADMERQGLKEMACLGDLVGYGAFPNEVVAEIRERSIPCIRGNYDDGVGFGKDECGCAYREAEAKALGERSFEWTKAHTTAENRSFLASLPTELGWEVEGWKVLLVHGSPRKINEYLYPDRSEASFRRIARAFKADVILFGHTHGPYKKLVEETYFINVGTGGKPTDGDTRVGYAVVAFEPRGGERQVKDAIEVEFRRVEYDVEAAAAAIESCGLPAEFPVELRQGRASH